MILRLLTIKTNNIEPLRAFYELLGIHFTKEQHQDGPEHYYSLDMGLPVEIYPTNELIQNHIAISMSVVNAEEAKQVLISNGFTCSEIKQTKHGTYFVTRDPDDNRVEVYE
ncbi:MAG TPA: VOC family protein [Candidatus Andersenbacteria bacterium]|nr:VOC family protein [Candidatus Andersenbacteria bacterium]